MKKRIGSILREARKRNGLEIEDVIDLLSKDGIEIKKQTLYNYETNIRSMSPDTFLALCNIYKIRNILEEFRGADIDYSIPTDQEWEIIARYRRLDGFGMTAVESILDAEYARCREHGFYAYDTLRAINFYRAPASAGPGQILFDDIDVEQIYIQDDPEYKRVAYAVECRGDSMEPELHDGDVLLIEPATDLRVGEIGIFYIDGDSYVKELGRGELISINPAYAPIPLTSEARCMGRVVDKLND